jgi:hypothetical protein
MQRSSFFGLVCVVALVAAVLLSVVSGAEANCNLVGKWRSFDNSEHYHINITFDFQADNTYQANVLAFPFISSAPLHFYIGTKCMKLSQHLSAGHDGGLQLQVRPGGNWCVAPAVEREAHHSGQDLPRYPTHRDGANLAGKTKNL